MNALFHWDYPFSAWVEAPILLGMRCLYCGKELALFKKLTGGGEFCSEEHRQRYHDEYNRLALSRLLQAPVAEPEPAEATTLRKRENAPPSLTAGGRRLIESRPEPARVEVAASAAPEPPVVEAAVEPAPPAGFVANVRMAAQGREVRPRAAEFRMESRPEAREVARPELRIEMTPSLGGLLGTTEPGREPAVPEPSAALSFETALDSGMATAVIWNYPATDFRPVFELRETLRLELRTSGIGLEPEDTAEPPASGVSVSISALGHNIALDREGPPAEEEAGEDEASEDLGGIEIPSLWDAPLSGGSPAAPAPLEAAPGTNAPPLASPVPLRALDPLPVPAAAAAPARPKAHQVYSTAGLAEEVAIPRLAGWPLRPVILLGPKPVEAAPAPGVDPSPVAPAAAETSAETGEVAENGPAGAPKLSRRERARLARKVRVAEPVTEAAAVAPATPVPPAVAMPAEPAVAPAGRTEPAVAPPPPAKPAPLAPAAAKPERRPEPAAPEVKIDAPSFGMRAGGSTDAGGGLAPGVKIAAAAGGVAVLAAIAYFGLSGGSGAAGPAVVREAPMLAMTEGSWATDWGSSEAGGRPRRIAFYRPTQALSDYRVSFRGEIPGRSLGWVFRAADPKNYYASRLEILKRGLNPTVVLVRYAMINGEETAATQIPLPMPVRIDTVYRVQVEALGNQFQTTVLGQVVDKWSDDRLKSGGVGLIYDRGDPMPETRSLEVTPLILQGKKR